MLYNILLIIHIIAGSVALLGAVIAIYTKIVNGSHQWHIYGGLSFFYGMLFVFLTTIPMTILKPNLFLFLIGIFSFYFAFMGWRMAVNRVGKAGIPEYTAMIIMSITSVVMIVWGGSLLWNDNGNGVTLIIFGALGAMFSISSMRQYQSGPIKGKERIGSHLGNMLGATIAAVTAVLVVNVDTDPVWLAWIAPTVIITPLIFWMTNRVRKGKL